MKTWKHRDGTVWPKDLLPDCDPNIRVLSYGYNLPIKGLANEGSIKDYAICLLDDLQRKREEKSAQKRSIVFVGHSVGGIVIKKVSLFSPWASQVSNANAGHLGSRVCSPG